MERYKLVYPMAPVNKSTSHYDKIYVQVQPSAGELRSIPGLIPQTSLALRRLASTEQQEQHMAVVACGLNTICGTRV